MCPDQPTPGRPRQKSTASETPLGRGAFVQSGLKPSLHIHPSATCGCSWQVADACRQRVWWPLAALSGHTLWRQEPVLTSWMRLAWTPVWYVSLAISFLRLLRATFSHGSLASHARLVSTANAPKAAAGHLGLARHGAKTSGWEIASALSAASRMAGSTPGVWLLPERVRLWSRSSRLLCTPARLPDVLALGLISVCLHRFSAADASCLDGRA